MTMMTHDITTRGFVTKAYGNLIQVRFEGAIRQGEVAMLQVDGSSLKAEVIEIAGEEAKLQIYEDTRGVKKDTEVHFTGKLLEAELGPGLLTSIVDGLQNPLNAVADVSGLFLPKGIYISPLDRTKCWDYSPVAHIGDTLTRGQTIGTTQEGRFQHRIMIPFSLFGTYTITWVIEPGFYSVDTVVAKVRDEKGKNHDLTMIQYWPVKRPLIEGEKIKASKPMSTGCRIVDTQFPILKGGTFCTPGPFGAGKTVLQHHLSKFSDVDIVVLVACGERAGEVVEILREFPHLIDPHTGESLINRTVIICNTSSMPVAAREASVYMGVTIAEYYRQMGLDILLLADSTSRWAQALREMSGRLEEIPGEEAFPAYLSSRIASFYERSGVVQVKGEDAGSITIGGAVSPAGGNFEEPVTQATLSVVGAFLGLSRERSNARRYPAIDPLLSWTKYVNNVGSEFGKGTEGWVDKVKNAGKMLRNGDEIEKRMEVVGEEGVVIEDMITYLKSELYDFCYLQQNSFDREDAYCPLKRQVPLFNLVCKIFDTDFEFKTHEEARNFFLNLQNAIKNMNFMHFESQEYHKAFAEVEKTVERARKIKELEEVQ
jgi:V/A-type H+/Na+-transporting ATPase subunit A